MRLWLLVTLLLLTACGAHPPAIVKTDVSSLLATPERFAGKRVEVDAILLLDFEVMVLLDPSNPQRDDIWFDYADIPSSEHESRGFPLLKTAFERSPKKEVSPFRMSARARIVGLFEHSEARRFGHLGAFQSQISLERIIDAAPYEEKPNKSPEPTRTAVPR